MVSLLYSNLKVFFLSYKLNHYCDAQQGIKFITISLAVFVHREYNSILILKAVIALNADGSGLLYKEVNFVFLFCFSKVEVCISSPSRNSKIFI